MAKIGDEPGRTAKSKPRSRAARPPFAPAAAATANQAWVYRSDAPAAVAGERATQPAAAKPVAAKPAPRGRARAPIASPLEARPSLMIHVLDVVTLPIAVSLMAVLAPMRRLLGSSRR